MKAASADVISVAQVLAGVYGLVGCTVEELPGEEDGNFSVMAPGDRRYVFKVAAPGATDDDVLLQCRLLDHVRGAGLEVDVPEVVPTSSGEILSRVRVGSGEQPARLLTWVPGSMVAMLPRRSPALFQQTGQTAARLALALADIHEPAADRTHHWDLRAAPTAVATMLSSVGDDEHRAAVEAVLGWNAERVGDGLSQLPAGVVHHDLNDHNLLALRRGDAHEWRLSGVLDFGDALLTARVADLAVAVAYAMLREPHPLLAACQVTAGYHSVLPLREDELSVLFPLAALRLCLNATTWDMRRAADPAHTYALDRMRHTWPTLARLRQSGPDVAEALLRSACDFDSDPHRAALLTAIRARPVVPVVPQLDGEHSAAHSLDLSPAGDGPDLQLPDPAGTQSVWISRHGEPRWSEHRPRSSLGAQPATISLGRNVIVPTGTEVRCPLPGVVVAVGDEDVVIRHVAAPGRPFWSRFGSVLPAPLEVGARVDANDLLGSVAGPPEDSWLPSNVFVQLARWLPPDVTAVPRFAIPDEAVGWLSTFIDPAPLLAGVPVDDSAADGSQDREVLDLRARRVARSQRTYYGEPMELVRADAAWFTDDLGNDYLDMINNVTHVGHGHPRVVAALTRQSRRLNTNSRFLYRELGRYADRLAELLPDPLEVVFFTCSGSESNDLALRIARAVTNRTDVAVIAGAYHGNTTAVTAISPNRYRGAGGSGRPDTTHELVQPDRYRGRYGYDDLNAGVAYGAEASATLTDMTLTGRPPAAVFAESLMGTAGQILHPPGYLAAVFGSARAEGALCVSDEVQVGFGRLGHHFWGFQGHGVVPDIVTMGKPMGNGHPLSAVVTSRAIADAFDTGMKYFNTFGGNPVSCEVGRAVLDVIRDEDLQNHALVTGTRLRHRLVDLADRHDVIGDVRGEGLYVGIDLVQDRDTKAPDRAFAYALSERMKAEGVVVYPNGDYDNVLKLKPPMVITDAEVDFFVDTLDRVLTDW